MVVSDTTPINYLALIGHIELLPRLFGKILMPPEVLVELRHPRTPGPVRDWVDNLPHWAEVRTAPIQPLMPDKRLGLGETAAIALALHTRAEFFLSDDLRARKAALSLGIDTLTTVLLLDAAADRGWISFNAVLNPLLQTNFRVDPDTLIWLRKKHSTVD